VYNSVKGAASLFNHTYKPFALHLTQFNLTSLTFVL